MTETKTISVKQIEVELWQQFRARAMLEGESVPAALNALLRQAVEKEENNDEIQSNAK